MRVHIRRGGRLKVLLVLSLLIIVIMFSSFSFGSGPGPNNRNYSVDTRVNISGSPPFVINATAEGPITLNPGGVTLVTCNFSVRDFNGFADIFTFNGSLYSTPVGENAVNDNSTKYFNSSCNPISGQQSGIYVNYSCQFPVNYYAVNGSWTCLGKVNDTYGLAGRGNATTTINALYALNVTPLIDYGTHAMGQYVPNQTANVTNLGNVPINITVKGYARNWSDNLSFMCEQGNLSLDLQHFSANNTADWATKQILNDSYRQVHGLTVPKAMNATPSLNVTYWELYLDPTQLAQGECNGTVVFQAESNV